jgi:enoyl-CoA hydratase/carnithine racemase
MMIESRKSQQVPVMSTSNLPDFPPLPDSLHAERDGEIALLRLNRPHKRNALNDATVLGVGRFFASLAEGVKAVVIHGAGEHFCAGLDLSELEERDAVGGVLHSRMWHRALDEVQFGRVPVVTVMHGAVVGGGLELASATHVRVAEPSTFYALPEGRRGIFLGGGGSVRITRLIGASRLTDMMLTGRVYTAEEGQQLALSHYLVGAGEGLRKGIELARKMAANAPMTNFALMHVLPRIAEAGQDQGLLTEALVAAIAQSAPEAKERIQQFLNKQAGTKVGAPK